MRILHVSDHYPPVVGGIETHVSELAARQAARGHEVSVLTSSRGQVPTDAPLELYERPWLGDPQDADGSAVRVVRVTDQRAPRRASYADVDVVHAHVSVVAPFTEPMTGWLAYRVPTVVTVHSLWSPLRPLPSLAAGIAGLWTAPVTWSAVSRLAAAQVRSALPGQRYVDVVNNAVEVAPRLATPSRLDGPVELVSTMRVAMRKRPRQLIAMFERLLAATPYDIRLTIVGDGPDLDHVARLVHRRGLADHVLLTGGLPRTDVIEVLARSDVYVAPSILESFGLAALEARCVGLPVVARSDSGVGEFVADGIHGLLVGSDREMVEAIRRLVEDAPLRERIAEHNRRTPAGFTWDSALRANQATYVAALASAGAVPRSRALLPDLLDE